MVDIYLLSRYRIINKSQRNVAHASLYFQITRKSSRIVEVERHFTKLLNVGQRGRTIVLMMTCEDVHCVELGYAVQQAVAKKVKGFPVTFSFNTPIAAEV
jgi:hypothetical protein